MLHQHIAPWPVPLTDTKRGEYRSMLKSKAPHSFDGHETHALWSMPTYQGRCWNSPIPNAWNQRQACLCCNDVACSCSSTHSSDEYRYLKTQRLYQTAFSWSLTEKFVMCKQMRPALANMPSWSSKSSCWSTYAPSSTVHGAWPNADNVNYQYEFHFHLLTQWAQFENIESGCISLRVLCMPNDLSKWMESVVNLPSHIMIRSIITWRELAALVLNARHDPIKGLNWSNFMQILYHNSLPK